jgi:mitochondrial fission protein ELM1
MKKTGLADSPFFVKSQTENEVSTPPLSNLTVQSDKPEKVKKVGEKKIKEPGINDTPVSRHHDTVIPRYHDTMQPRHHDTVIPRFNGAIIEQVRKAVKEYGKEAATHRFTDTEKKEIADLIYTYKSNGIKTSENEVTRIAVNFILEDYKENGENSVLHNILKALNR